MILTQCHSAKRRALSFLELVFAMGLLFFAAGGVMTIIVAGAGYPLKAQQATVRDNIARLITDQMIDSGALTPVPLTPALEPGFSYQVDIQASPFDVNASVVQVDVRGPAPLTTVSTMRSVSTKLDGASVMAQYSCFGCHDGTGTTAPIFSAANLAAAQAANNAALTLAGQPTLTLDQYIGESVRLPSAFLVVPYSPLMTGYPSTTDMPQSDLNAITVYLKSLP